VITNITPDKRALSGVIIPETSDWSKEARVSGKESMG
jgi:hypothetical protein